MTDKSVMDALDLLVATDELLLTELSDHVQDYLLHQQNTWLQNNLIVLWQKVHLIESCRKLQETILPPDILEDIMRYHLKPACPPQPVVLARRLQFDSALIRPYSFLFTFGDRGMVEDAKLSRVSRQRSYYAIRFNGRSYGPCFGDKDLSMKDNFNLEGSCSCQKDDYLDSVTDSTTFSVDDYE
ncbi:17823_t:CDS:2, partial [Racocetra fulgida]